MQEFRFRAPRYLDLRPLNDWEWLFLMQHYGLPTRLLDWTESSLIGLYFALRDHRETHDAAVWMLNDWAPATEGKTVGGVLPVAIKPVQASPRITAQKGFFTIHGTDVGAMDRLSSSHSNKGPGLRKLTIPKTHVEKMRRDLTIAGITETTVFQELDGLSRELKAWFFGT